MARSSFCQNPYKEKDDLLIDCIVGKQKRMKISNEEMGKCIGKSPNYYAIRKYKPYNFTGAQLRAIFKRLGVADDDPARGALL